jgi:hypothetical protein
MVTERGLTDVGREVGLDVFSTVGEDARNRQPGRIGQCLQDRHQPDLVRNTVVQGPHAASLDLSSMFDEYR